MFQNHGEFHNFEIKMLLRLNGSIFSYDHLPNIVGARGEI